MRIQGISALVTGAASGLGLATARQLAGLGATVTLVDLPTSGGAAAAADLSPTCYDRLSFAALLRSCCAN